MKVDMRESCFWLPANFDDMLQVSKHVLIAPHLRDKDSLRLRSSSTETVDPTAQWVRGKSWKSRSNIASSFRRTCRAWSLCLELFASATTAQFLSRSNQFAFWGFRDAAKTRDTKELDKKLMQFHQGQTAWCYHFDRRFLAFLIMRLQFGILKRRFRFDRFDVQVNAERLEDASEIERVNFFPWIAWRMCWCSYLTTIDLMRAMTSASGIDQQRP
jgi:hypothetical protein